MKKKVLLFILIAAMICSVLVGCGDDSNSDTTQSTNSATTEAATQPSTFFEGVGFTVPNVEDLTYADYNAMSQDEQQAVVDSFNNLGEFFEWYEEKKEEYKENPVPPTTDGPLFPEVTDSTAPEKDELTFLEYHNLSADEQKAFINTFDSIDKFVEWHTAARKAYEDSLIEIDDTPIDAGELFGDKEDKDGN